MISRCVVTKQSNLARLTAMLALLVSLTAGAVVHHVPPAQLPDIPANAELPSKSNGNRVDDILRQNGIAQGSTKARIIAAWLEEVLRDPVIVEQMPGGAPALEQIFLDEEKRDALLSNGLARLSRADRLLYLQLLTRLLDELVPVNCFGLADIRAAMNRITIADMSDADAELYLGLLHKVLVSSASNVPVSSPTPQQYAAAIEALSREIVVELKADPADLDRYQLYTGHPESATPSDICWATRVMLHAADRMPETDRDLILMPALTGVDPASLPRPAAQNLIPTPEPSSARAPQTTTP